MKKRVLEGVSLLNIVTLVAVMMLPVFYFAQTAEAAPNLDLAIVRLDRMAASTGTSGMVCAKPKTAQTEAFVVVKFPADFTITTTSLATNWAVNATTNSSWPSSSTPWPGIGTAATAADNGAKTATFASTDLTVGVTYCFNWTATTGVSTGAAASGITDQGYIETQTSGPAAIDHSAIAFTVLSGANSDQVLVTGAVNPTFTFTMSANAAAMGVMSNGATAASAGITTAVITNARGGWTSWVKSTTGSLTSASTGATAIASPGTCPTPTTLSTGTTGYGFAVTTVTNGTGGSAASAACYDATGAQTDRIGTLTTTFQPFAAGTAATGGTGDQITFATRARVTTTQPPATDYTDTLTVVAAGLF